MRMLFFALIILNISKSAAQELEIQLNVELKSIENNWLLPVPKDLIKQKSNITLSANGNTIKALYNAQNLWPLADPDKSIRLLAISFNSQLKGKQNFQLSFNPSNKEIPHRKVHHTSTLVFPNYQWLRDAILLHPMEHRVNNDWYTKPQTVFAKYIANNELLAKHGVDKNSPAQYLYDRPQALYQLHLMTEDSFWLDMANQSAEFYLNNIDQSGFFTLKKNKDIKYLMPRGLYYKYLLTGDNNTIQTIERIYRASLNWNPSYVKGRGFWTERNQATALNSAITYWEATGDASAVERIEQIINATYEMTFNNNIGWQFKGCPMHTLSSHEGKGGDVPVCSPWMMALLGDGLWRYYLLTGDMKAAELLESFGDFILNYGIYFGTEGKIKGHVIPKYLSVFSNLELVELEQWSDSQHTCDVGALVGKAVWIKKMMNKDNFILKELFSVFQRQCTIYYKLFKEKSLKVKYWKVSPPRKFNWMYSTTSDYPWLTEALLSSH